MKIFINQNNIVCQDDIKSETVLTLNVGALDISNIGTSLVDNIVLDIINYINNKESVFVISNENIESKMIARKIEDRIKREVSYINKI